MNLDLNEGWGLDKDFVFDLWVDKNIKRCKHSVIAGLHPTNPNLIKIKWPIMLTMCAEAGYANQKECLLCILEAAKENGLI